MPDTTFQLSRWATLDPAAGWQIGAGPFLGGPGEDLLAYQPANGTLWVGRNNGNAFGFTGSWATVQPAAGWQFAAGDVTGDGHADVVGYSPSNGSVWVGINQGSAFRLARWTTLTPASGWRITTGFFHGTSTADLLAFHDGSGTFWVGANRGAGFAFTGVWASVPGGRNWVVTAEDFAGDGLTDIAAYDPTDGAVWVGRNQGSSFQLSQWATLTPAAGWQIAAGRFTGRDKADLLAYHPSTGGLWIGENTGGAFAFTAPSATLQPPDGWQILAASTNGDLWDDVVGYSPGNGSVWVGQTSVLPVEGYCWPLSAAPGEAISFALSGRDGAASASVQRHVSTSADVTSHPVTTVSFTAARQDTPAAPYRDGCGWAETFRLAVPADWPSGIYSAACTDADETTCDITFVVGPRPDRRAHVAVIANVNTWLAYNGWGGQSKYTGLARTSFLRPMPGAAPAGDMHLTRGELWILGWLEREGIPADVVTDIDFHNDGCDPAQYPFLILGTHPEYWSVQEYDNLRAYLDGGGSLGYLGGNGVFETGSFDADDTVVVFRNGIEGGPREAALFRALGRPELSVLGVATERCSVAGSPYVVRAADHPLFAGTGVSNGDTFGTSGFNTGSGNGEASAWEVDTSRGRGATGMPTDCLLSPEVIAPAGLPTGLVVLATGVPDAAGPGADMTCYDHPGGGIVFSAGSITFGGSLVVDAVLSGVLRNALHGAKAI